MTAILLLQSNSSYLLSFLLTIFIEGVIVLLISRSCQQLFYSVTINLITHPWAYFAYENRYLNLFATELVVISIELVLWKVLTNRDLKYCLLLSLITNISSALLGVYLSG